MKIYTLVIVLFFSILRGQDVQIEKIKDIKPLKINGGVSLNNTIIPTRDTTQQLYTYMFTGNINVTILEQFSMPIRFSYSNLKFSNSITNPFDFNTLSIRPSYKWLKLYIGDNSMSYSQYTYTGILFRGLGAELTPEGPIKFSFFGGRIQKSQDYNPNDSTGIIPAYYRMGYGLKTEYKINNSNIGLILFYSEDKENSIIKPPDSLSIFPKENMAIGINISTYIYESLKLDFEYNNSSITENKYSETIKSSNNSVSSFFIRNKISTKYYHQYKVGLSFPLLKGSVGLNYDRVDPNYKTLGALFFNNDYENYAINISQNILNNKISINSNFGYRRNDLDNTLESETKNILFNISMEYKPLDILNFSTSYSNISNIERVKDLFNEINNSNPINSLGIDTTRFMQVSQSFNFITKYIISKSSKEINNSLKSVSINFTLSDASNLEGGQVVRKGNLTRIYNISTGYNYTSAEKLSINTTFNYNYTDVYIEVTRYTLGPTLTISKPFFDNKLNCSSNISFNSSFEDNKKKSDNFNLGINLMYLLLKKHNFTMNINYNYAKTNQADKLSNMVILWGYSYNFDIYG